MRWLMQRIHKEYKADVLVTAVCVTPCFLTCSFIPNMSFIFSIEAQRLEYGEVFYHKAAEHVRGGGALGREAASPLLWGKQFSPEPLLLKANESVSLANWAAWHDAVWLHVPTGIPTLKWWSFDYKNSIFTVFWEQMVSYDEMRDHAQLLPKGSKRTFKWLIHIFDSSGTFSQHHRLILNLISSKDIFDCSQFKLFVCLDREIQVQGFSVMSPVESLWQTAALTQAAPRHLWFSSAHVQLFYFPLEVKEAEDHMPLVWEYKSKWSF